MKFKKSPKIYRGYKSRYPKETVNEAKRFFASLKLDVKYYQQKPIKEEIPSYTGTLKINNRYFSAGKGLTRDLCKASAYAEAVERTLSYYSPEIRFKEQRIKELKRGDYEKIEIADFFKNFNLKEKKEDEDFMNWRDSYSLSKNEKVLLPHDFIEDICSSNGLASGNTLEEAVTHGFCEVFERYSLAEHITKKIETNTIDKGSIKNKTIQNFIKLFESLNIEVEIKDMTLQGKVPVMGVLFTNNNVKDSNKVIKSVFHKELTVGAAIDLELAIIRCFTERIQSSASDKSFFTNPGELINRIGEFEQRINIFDNYYTKKDHEKIIKNLEKTKHYLNVKDGRSIEDFNYLEKGETVPFSSLKSTKNKDFLDDIKEIKKILKDNSWDAYIVDYSIKDCFINVVRIIIPSVSDVLKFLFEEGYSFDRPKDIYYIIKNMIDFNERRISLKGEERFEFLKYEQLPYLLIPWVSSPIEKNALDVVLEMKDVLSSNDLLKERERHEKFFGSLFI